MALILTRFPWRWAALVGVYVCLGGCASFPGKDLPAYTYADLPPAPSEKICVLIPEKVREKHRELTDIAIEVLEKSGYFLTGPEKCAPSGATRYSVSMRFRNDLKAGNMTVALLSGFVSGFTFTIIPGYGRDDYVFTVEYKKDNQLINRYEYREHVDTWIHISMLFKMSGHAPRATLHEIYRRMLMNFLYDFSRDVQHGAQYAQFQ